MGARISIQYKKGEDKSAVLFSHWGGSEFAQDAISHANKVAKKYKGKKMFPLERLEPATVLVDFISSITKGNEITNDLYLPENENGGDNSDYGHHVIDLDEIEKNA